MRIRYFWRERPYRQQSLPIDAFWVEATQEEAVAVVFPSLSQQQMAESSQLAETYGALAAMMGDATRPFCFLVARDLSSIDPLPLHYPVHQMWNAYSPFESMPEIAIDSLDDLRDIVLPPLAQAVSETGGGQETDQL